MTRPTVLLVEDDEVLRSICFDVLEEHGFRVMLAADAVAALAISAAGEPIDVVISDIVLTEMNGIELARRLRAQRPALRVLWMSGHPSDHLDVGDAFLKKPFTAELLVERVRSLL